MPAMAVVCPKDSNGERIDGSWKFHYDGWNLEDTVPPEYKERHNEFCREHATSEVPSPEERNGCLDKQLLTRLGLTQKRMVDLDALFFIQLLLPICDPAKSGVPHDPRRSFYDETARFTNIYPYQRKGYSGNYGHNFPSTNSEELVNWDGIGFRNNNTNIHDCWIDKEDSNSYDPIIANTMYHHR